MKKLKRDFYEEILDLSSQVLFASGNMMNMGHYVILIIEANKKAGRSEKSLSPETPLMPGL